MKRPIVAVTCDRRDVGLKPVSMRIRPARPEVYVNEVVVRRLRDAGAVVMLIPPGDVYGALMLLNRANALVITGGAHDIHPRHYGQAVEARLDRTDDARTDVELELAREAIGRGIPMLGVCGGMQVMVVAAGGTLIQHVEGHEQATDPVEAWHPLIAESGGPAELLAAIGSESNSTHHQAVGELGPFAVLARAPDGVVEAIYLPGARFCVGVQGHPELRSRGIFEAFVAAVCGDRRAE